MYFSRVCKLDADISCQSSNAWQLFVPLWRCMLSWIVLQVESAAERDLWIDAVNTAADVPSATKVSTSSTSSDR